MRQCNNYEEALSCDCSVCDESCKFRKTGNGLSTAMVLLFVLISFVALLYYATQQLGLTGQQIIEIVLIIVFLVMTYSFANLAAGRKDGDKQIIADLKKENNLLSSKNAELRRKLDKLLDNRAQRTLNKLKLGSKTRHFSLGDHPTSMDCESANSTIANGKIDENPYLLSGDELQRTENARKSRS